MPPKGKQNNKKGGKKPVPKKLNVPPVEWALQKPEERAQTLKEIKTKFGALGLRGVEIVEMKETQHPSKMFMQQLTAVGACTDAQGKELAKYSNLDDVFDKFEVEISNVCVGTKMPFLVSAFDLEGKDHPILEDRRGKFVFLQFWAPWEERCQRQTAKVVELAAKRADWAGKVCFLTVGCDTTLEKLKATLTEKSWLGAPNVTHLWSGAMEEKEDGDDIITKYELEDVPECMLIDGEGKLLKRADIEDFNLEVHLEKYLAGVKDYEGEPRPVLPDSFHALTPEARTALIDQMCAAMSAEPRFSKLALVTTEARIHPIIGNIVDEEQHIMLMGKVDVAVEAKVAQLCKMARDAHVTDLEQVVMVTAPPTPVEPTAACFICKKAFVAGEDVRWHCALCPSGVTMCTPCINKDSKAPRNERCGHPHYHPWFRIGPQTTADDLKDLEFGIGRFGVALVDEAEEEKKEQRQPQEEKPGHVVHEDVFCNGCEGAITDMPRWKCCSCEDFDFCDDCFGKHIQNTPAPKKAAKKKGGKGKEKQPVGHEQRHVFIRIDDSELVRIGGDDDEDEGDEGDMDHEFDEGDMDLLAGLDGDDLEGFDGTEAIVQRIRELNAGDSGDEVVLTTSKGKPKIREVADEHEASEPGSDEDSEAEEEEKAKKPKAKPKAAAAKGKTAQPKKTKKDGSDDDSEAEDTQLNQMAEEAAQVPLPEDDEDF